MKFRNIILTLLAIFTLAVASKTKAQKYKISNIFPYHKQLEESIGFWNKIYTKYNSDQILIHHKDNFDIYYILDFSKQLSSLSEKEKEKKKKDINEIVDHQARLYEMQLRLKSMVNPSELKKIKDYKKYKEKEMKIRAQSGQSDKFRQGIIESGAYIDSVFTILKEENVPEDIIALIFVESMFNPEAGSKAGAIGAWQLTKDAANKIYDENDIKLVGRNFDYRTDLFKSTRKAAKIFKNNYQQLRKWDLAILAYNYGLNGTLRATEKHKDLVEIINNHDTSIFRFATKNFYSEFLAALHVWKNYEKFFGKLKLKEPKEITETIHIVRKGETLSDIAPVYTTTVENIMKQNNLNNTTIYPNQKLIIYNDKQIIKKEDKSIKIEKQPPKQIKQQYKPQPSLKLEDYIVPISFYIHDVIKYETLSEIAIKCNLNIEKIMFLNGLGNSDIYENQELFIPIESKPDTTYFIHTIRGYTTLSHIVDFYVRQYNLKNLKIRKIKELNNLESEHMLKVQKLKIPIE